MLRSFRTMRRQFQRVIPRRTHADVEPSDRALDQTIRLLEANAERQLARRKLAVRSEKKIRRRCSQSLSSSRAKCLKCARLCTPFAKAGRCPQNSHKKIFPRVIRIAETSSAETSFKDPSGICMRALSKNRRAPLRMIVASEYTGSNCDRKAGRALHSNGAGAIISLETTTKGGACFEHDLDHHSNLFGLPICGDRRILSEIPSSGIKNDRGAGVDRRVFERRSNRRDADADLRLTALLNNKGEPIFSMSGYAETRSKST